MPVLGTDAAALPEPAKEPAPALQASHVPMTKPAPAPAVEAPAEPQNVAEPEPAVKNPAAPGAEALAEAHMDANMADVEVPACYLYCTPTPCLICL